MHDTNFAANYLGVKPGTLGQMASEGRGPAYVKVGRLRRYRIEDLDAFIEANRVEPKAAA